MRATNVPAAMVTAPLSAGASRAAQGALLLVVGDGFVSTFELTGRDLLIGRGEDADIRIDNRALSRRHALVRGGTQVTTVQDLGSTNGTRIGGLVRCGGEPVALAGQDGFQIGPYSFVLVARRVRAERSFGSSRDLLRIVDPTPGGVPPLVGDVAASDASVLILGETGVGKEVMAETLHELSGRRGAFVRVNCAALSESLLESELFGHEKGAFTGATAAKEGLLEAAAGGTVFLDELGELPLSIQAKLLRAVERREVLRVGAVRPARIDVRFIAATNRDLPAEVAAGAFRRDLYFRLDGVTLEIPPLRERRSLIAPLAIGFLNASRAGSASPRQLPTDVLAALEAYPWPGNVRELKSVIERAVLLARSGDIGVRHLAFTRRPLAEPVDPAAADTRPVRRLERHPGDEPVEPWLELLTTEERAERDRVLAALDECAGNQTRAAKLLGIGRTSLINKLRLFRIPRPRT